MYLKSFARCSLLLGVVVSSLLTGCSRSISDVDSAGKTLHPVFPGIDSAIRKEGIVVAPEQLSLLGVGLTKPQLYHLLGAPHFSEGVLGVKEWDYILKVKGSDGLKTCQLKILFDKNMTAQSYYYLPENCQADATAEKMVIGHSKKTFSSEALFDFNSAELRLDSLHEISEFASELPDHAHIRVTGYTDRLGTASHNNMLSTQRAEAVKDYLVSQGIDHNKIMAIGMGANNPQVACSEDNFAQLISCLSPNRRVSIDIIQ